MMAEKNLKEIFELRIKYLKRSENYKNMCESARETGITLQPVPEQYKGKGNLLALAVSKTSPKSFTKISTAESGV